MTNEKRYPATCCECGHEFWATKSLAQDMGRNDYGCGSCPKCQTFLNLTFDQEQEKMLTMKWDEYLEKLKKRCTG